MTDKIRVHESIATADLDRLDALLYRAIEHLDHDQLPAAERVPIPEGMLTVEAYMDDPPKPIGFWVTVDRATVARLDRRDLEIASRKFDEMAAAFERAHFRSSTP